MSEDVHFMDEYGEGDISNPQSDVDMTSSDHQPIEGNNECALDKRKLIESEEVQQRKKEILCTNLNPGKPHQWVDNRNLSWVYEITTCGLFIKNYDKNKVFWYYFNIYLIFCMIFFDILYVCL